MSILSIALALSLTQAPPAAPSKEAPWKKAAETDGITVYNRDKEGTNLKEVKAEGEINAPPMKVWAAIRDYENYSKTMPYTEESKVLSKDPDGKSLLFYSVINAPLVSRRDYIIQVKDESDWQDGKGYLKTTWTAGPQGQGPPPRSGIVRVLLNDGYWILKSKDGQKTQATYYLYTDPGGSLPKWIANKANGTAVPDVFKHIRKTTSH